METSLKSLLKCHLSFPNNSSQITSSQGSLSSIPYLLMVIITFLLINSFLPTSTISLQWYGDQIKGGDTHRGAWERNKEAAYVGFKIQSLFAHELKLTLICTGLIDSKGKYSEGKEILCTYIFKKWFIPSFVPKRIWGSSSNVFANTLYCQCILDKFIELWLRPSSFLGWRCSLINNQVDELCSYPTEEVSEWPVEQL